MGSCETGLSWGRLVIVEINSSPALGRMFQARPSAGLGISRVLGSDRSFSANRRIGATGGHPASSNRVAGSGECAVSGGTAASAHASKLARQSPPLSEYPTRTVADVVVDSARRLTYALYQDLAA